MPLDQLNADTVMSQIEKVLNSDEDLDIDDSFKIIVGTIELPKRSGYARITNMEEAKDKRSIQWIKNTADDMCLARAIASSWAVVNKISNEEFNRKYRFQQPSKRTLDLIMQHRKVPGSYYHHMGDATRNEGTEIARAFHNLADLPEDYPCSLSEINQFEEALDIRVLVVSARMGNKFIYIGKENPHRKNVYVYLKEDRGVGHVNSITSLTGFFGQSYFCENCLKPYQNREQHNCERYCFICKTDKCYWVEAYPCDDCHMTCRSGCCFDWHKEVPEGGKSQCALWWKCPTCKRVVNRKKRDTLNTEHPHVCGEYQCSMCQQNVTAGHLCYQRSLPPKKHIDKLIIFDFECRQDEAYGPHHRQLFQNHRRHN